MYLPRQVTRTSVSEEKYNKKQKGEASEWGWSVTSWRAVNTFINCQQGIALSETTNWITSGLFQRRVSIRAFSLVTSPFTSSLSPLLHEVQRKELEIPLPSMECKNEINHALRGLLLYLSLLYPVCTISLEMINTQGSALLGANPLLSPSQPT